MEVDTKTRILDSAQRLFAAHGFDATSLRDITNDAKVNLASVNYHFRTKEDLFCAVYERVIAPTSQRRLALLDEVESSGYVTLERVLDAFFRPIIELSYLPDGRRSESLPLIGRMFLERSELTERIIRSYLRPVGERFLKSLHRLLPEIEHLELVWRFHFMIGAMAHTLAAEPALMLLSDGAANPADVEAVIARLISFNAAGLRAGVLEKSHA